MIKASKRQLALLRSLRTRKGRRETGLFLVEGLRLCSDLATGGLAIEFVLVDEDRLADPRIASLVEQLVGAGVTIANAADHEIQWLSDTVHSQGIVAAAHWNDVSMDAMCFGPQAIVLALDRVSDPGNVGTVIRTAAWFGADAVLLGENCADLLNPKTVRSTMGGLFHLPVIRNVNLPNAINTLKGQSFTLNVASSDGTSDWKSWAAKKRTLLVLGNEAEGVSADVRALADYTLAIPRRGKGESLNVAVTAGVFLSAVR